MARTGRPRTFDRDAALTSAMHLFWEHGYAATSLQQLREAMGDISAASFYAAFVSKEMLFREAVKRYAATHGQVTDALSDRTLPHREAIETSLRASARMQTDATHPSGCLIGSSPLVTGIDNAELGAFVAGFRQANRATIKARVDEAIAAGGLDAGATGLAALYDALLVGFSSQARDAVPIEAMEEAIDGAMQLWDHHSRSA